MQLNNISIAVVVGGREVSEYVSPMNFQHYIEGRDGSEFGIRIRNNTSSDVEAIISVDGLSITDGEPAGSGSRGYIISARGAVTIPGWKLDGQEAAKFRFSGKKGGSYAEQSGRGRSNLGVIGLMAFARKPAFNHVSFPKSPLRASGLGGSSRGIGYNSGSMNNATCGGGLVGASTWECSSTSDASATPAYWADANLDSAQLSSQNLGTEFGEATQFRTTNVEFERGDMLTMMELFYDDRQGLKAVGINVADRASRPSAFPANTGCKPPAAWAKS